MLIYREPKRTFPNDAPPSGVIPACLKRESTRGFSTKNRGSGTERLA